MLENENNKKNADLDYEKRIENMIREYEQAKELLTSAMTNNMVQSITVEEVFQCIDDLYALKNYGLKIRQMRESQESARMSEASMGSREVRFDPEYKIPSDYLRHVVKPIESESSSSEDDDQKSPSVKDVIKKFNK